MPQVRFGNQLIDCQQGSNLRRVLMDARVPLYNGIARHIHCRGMGTCGTCAVQVDGPISAMTAIEKWRLGFPPHRRQSELRLACQCKVLGDCTVRKHGGMWGQQRLPGDQAGN